MTYKPTRREWLATTGAAGAALYLTACGGSSSSSSASSAASSGSSAAAGGASSAASGASSAATSAASSISTATAKLKPANMTFTTWGGDAELKGYKQIIAAFQQANSGVTVKLEVVPYASINQTVDARLQASKGPDLFRTTYNDIGFYGKEGGLADLSKYFPDGYGDQFNPALWSAVSVDGKAYGVPQHTDVSALVYNKALLTQAGVSDIPTSLDSAWSWDQFVQILDQIKSKTGAFPFAMNWQLFGAYRWMNWLYADGGKMLDGSGKPALESPEGEETLALFKSWHDKGLYPPNLGPKGPGYPDEIFPSGKIAMISAGDFLLPSLATTVKKFEWGATFLPKGKGGSATDLGGTAVVVSKDAKEPEAAAAFAQFVVTEDNQKLFCELAATIPTLKSLATAKLNFAVRPDLMPIFLSQATTLPADLVKAVTIPNFTDVNTSMQKELDAFLSGGQSSTDALKHMDAAIDKVQSQS